MERSKAELLHVPVTLNFNVGHWKIYSPIRLIVTDISTRDQLQQRKLSH